MWWRRERPVQGRVLPSWDVKVDRVSGRLLGSDPPPDLSVLVGVDVATDDGVEEVGRLAAGLFGDVAALAAEPEPEGSIEGGGFEQGSLDEVPRRRLQLVVSGPDPDPDPDDEEGESIVESEGPPSDDGLDGFELFDLGGRPDDGGEG